MIHKLRQNLLNTLWQLPHEYGDGKPMYGDGKRTEMVKIS